MLVFITYIILNMNSFGRAPWMSICVKQITLYIFIFIIHVPRFRTCFSKSPNRDFVLYNKQMATWTESDRNLQNEVRLICSAGFSFSSNNFNHHLDYDQYLLSQQINFYVYSTDLLSKVIFSDWFKYTRCVNIFYTTNFLHISVWDMILRLIPHY